MKAIKKQPRREKTEEEILDAFERVLLREGAHNVSVMSISREAQVAKTLIYKYFGGLVGLIGIWAIRREVWPNLVELFSDTSPADFADNPLLYQKKNLLRLAEYLRSNPLLLELLKAELMETGAVSDALRELRVEGSTPDTNILGLDLTPPDLQGKPTLRIFNAAISYLVLRARTSPTYMGIDNLDSDEGWDEVMSDLEEIFDDLIAFQEQMTLANKRLTAKNKRV